MKLVQKGSSARLAIFYHVADALFPALRAALPGWTIGAETFGNSDQDYKLSTNGGKVTPAPQAFAALASLASEQEDPAGGTKGGGTLLAGFSRGCQGVRAQLAGGFSPSAALAMDGAHASNPPGGTEVPPWRDFAALAKDRKRLMGITATAIDIPNRQYLATREVLPMITGFDDTGDLAAKGWQEAGKDQGGRPVFRRVEGNLVAFQFAGKDAPAHVEQARVIMPSLAQILARAIETRQGLEGGPLDLPAPQPWPVPGKLPANKQDTPPSPPPPRPLPPPADDPPASNDTGGGALVAAGLFVLLLAAAGRKR